MQIVLAAIQSRAQEMRIVVLGDLMLDVFQDGRIVRESPESPGTPVFQCDGYTLALGGAANAAHNLRALGAQVYLAGTCGADEEGMLLRGIAKGKGINVEAVICDPYRPTTAKTRLIADERQLVRIDRETEGPISTQIEGFILDALPLAPDAIVLSDYQNGVLTPRLLSLLINAGKAGCIPVLVDPKGEDFSRYRGATAITPNLEEAQIATGIEVRSPWDAVQAIAQIEAQVACRYTVLKQGHDGMAFHDRESNCAEFIPAANLSPVDVTGAGDTVIAVLALGLALGCDPLATVRLANVAAGVAVGKPNTATVSPEEIRQALEIAEGVYDC